jgi:hypothetical protein
MPDPTGSSEMMPDPTGSSEMMPDPTGYGEMLPDLTGSGEIMPDPTGTLGRGEERGGCCVDQWVCGAEGVRRLRVEVSQLQERGRQGDKKSGEKLPQLAALQQLYV